MAPHPCWLLAAFGVRPPLALHLIAPAALGVLNRAAARRLEYEPFKGFLAGRAGAVVLGSAFGAILGTGTLAAAAGLWAGLRVLGALRVEAGVLAVNEAAACFGTGFHVFAGLLLAGTAVAVGQGYRRGYRRLTVTELTVSLDSAPPSPASGSST